MLLGFKPVLVPKILDGTKIHTQREDPKRRWRPGMKIHMATGIRTKNYNCFNDKKICVSTQNIRIDWSDALPFEGCYPDVFIDGIRIAGAHLPELAKNDGFDSVEDYFKWFNETWEGVIIHWTPFRYPKDFKPAINI